MQKIGGYEPKGIVTRRSVTDSYYEAVKECDSKVKQIVAECRRTNTKYTDHYFDLHDMDYCLNSLTATVRWL